MNYLEIDACIAAGLDYWQWEQGLYPKWVKAKVVAWYKLHNLIEAHSADANYKPPKKR